MNEQAIAQTVRAKMRDIALIIVRLSTEADVAQAGSFQAHCMAALNALEADLAEAGMPKDEREKAVYAASCLLDEAALEKLAGNEREQWQAAPLQVTRFGNLQGGELVFEQMQAALAEAAPSIWLLACWQLVLGLGFKGRYALSSESERRQLLSRLDSLLPKTKDTPANMEQPSRVIHWRSFSPLAWALISWIAAGLLYLALRGILQNAVDMIGR